jgi:serine/threonine protein kinase
VLGTFTYMSPEQVDGESLGPETDVFSLGSVLAYAATGRGPFDAPRESAVMLRVLHEPPDLNGITGQLRDLITWCLQKAPADRPTLSAVLTRLNSATF